MLIDTAMFVSTPIMRTASWLSLWSMKMRVTLNMSHAKPEVAQPEWMPPRCCNADVQPSRNHNGGHYNRASMTAATHDTRTAYLGKAEVDGRVQYPPKELIAHEDGEPQVTQDKRARVSTGVIPYVQDS